MPSPVLQQQATGRGFTPVAITLGFAPTSGNYLILSGGMRGAGVTISSISQTGVTWTNVAAGAPTSFDVEIWIGAVGAGASTSISVTLSSGSDLGSFNVSEWDQLNGAIDSGGANVQGGSGNPFTLNFNTTTNGNDLLYSVARQGTSNLNDVNFNALTPTTGGGNNDRSVAAYQVVTATGTYTVAYSGSGTTYDAITVGFKYGASSFTGTKTQTATARIQVTGTKTQTAKARIQTTGTKTQSATARIQATGTKTQPATARIQSVLTKTQAAVARIQITGTKTQPAVARIQNTETKTQVAVARIQKVFTKTQPAVARIQIVGTKVQVAVARIRSTTTATQSARARIQNTASAIQTATASIVATSTVSKTQTAKARIQVTGTATQTSIARIQVTKTKTQTATATISVTSSKTQTATARIRNTTLFVVYGDFSTSPHAQKFDARNRLGS